MAIDEGTNASAAARLPSHAHIVVIGGGIMGCSTLHHLAKLGAKDLVLLEKSVLTAGSTWHAAGMVPGFGETLLVTRVLKGSLDTYYEMAADPDYPVDVHRCGSIRLARSADEILENRRFLGLARQVDMEAEIIDTKRIKELYPLLNTTGIIGGLWLPNDCYTDPSQTTQAYARRARKSGARIFQKTKVERITRKPNGSWRIGTSAGEIDADIIVNCGGMWAKEISALVGGVLPGIAIEHQYLVTEEIPETANLTRELPMLWDMSIPTCTRADRRGLFVAAYEDHPCFFGIDGVPSDFGQELLPPDLERSESRIATILEMIPCLKSVGIKTVVNGPTPRSPDMMPLVGPAHGYNNFFVMCSVSGGFLFSSTARYAAEWIVNGEPSINISPFDVRRFGAYADKRYAMNRLFAGHAFEMPVYYPHLESTAGRPVLTSALYHCLKSKGAVFGSRNGWEVVNWFAPAGMAAEDQPSYGRANWFEPVGREFRSVASRVGVLDSTCLGKFEVVGSAAESYLNLLTCNALPKPGRLRVAPVLNKAGHVIANWLIGRLGEDRFYVTTAPHCTQADLDILGSGPGGDLQVTDVSNRTAALTLAGPRAGELLRRMGLESTLDVLRSRFAIRESRLGWIPVRILSVNWGTVPVWELHTPTEFLTALYEAVAAAGKKSGLIDFGMRAAEAMRLEAGLPIVGTDIPPGFDPWQAGLGKFVQRKKSDFVGRSAIQRGPAAKGARLVRLQISKDASGEVVEPWKDEPLLAGEQHVGAVTSAFFGYGIGKPLGFAILDAPATTRLGELQVHILGRNFPVQLMEAREKAEAVG